MAGWKGDWGLEPDILALLEDARLPGEGGEGSRRTSQLLVPAHAVPGKVATTRSGGDSQERLQHDDAFVFTPTHHSFCDNPASGFTASAQTYQTGATAYSGAALGVPGTGWVYESF